MAALEGGAVSYERGAPVRGHAGLVINKLSQKMGPSENVSHEMDSCEFGVGLVNQGPCSVPVFVRSPTSGLVVGCGCLFLEVFLRVGKRRPLRTF